MYETEAERKDVWVSTFSPIYLRVKNILSTWCLATDPENNKEIISGQ